MPLTAAVIGCGNISRFHFSGYQKAGVQVKWVCDLSEQAAAPWVKQLGAQYSPEYSTVTADSEVDLIDITTYSGAHKELALAAIEAGKAVIIEKTLAETADDALEVVERAEKKGTILYTSYMKRFIPAVQKAKELLPSIGTIVSTSIRAFQSWGDLWDGQPADGFFGRAEDGMSEVKRRYGGGILVCGGSHILDLVNFFLGRPVRLTSTMHMAPGGDLDLQAAALIETENGIVHFEALAHPLKKIGFLHDGWDERLEINGTQGRLEVLSASWDDPYHKASMLIHYDNETGNSLEYHFDPVSPFDLAISYFCSNIEQGKQGSQSIYTGYEVDELIETMKRSAESGQKEDVQWRIG